MKIGLFFLLPLSTLAQDSERLLHETDEFLHINRHKATAFFRPDRSPQPDTVRKTAAYYEQQAQYHLFKQEFGQAFALPENGRSPESH